MSRKAALLVFVNDIVEDVRDYRMLRELLQQQFEVAMKHNALRLTELAAQISETAGALEKRRKRRSALMGSLPGKNCDITAILALVNDAAREAVKARWIELEGLVRECKELNDRNGRLMMDQYAIMQRVLHGEEKIYVPA